MRVPNALQMGVVSALCLGSFALGTALHLPAMAAQVYQQYASPDTTCTSSSPCTTTTNNGSGPASANTSVGGTALTGTTKFNGTSKTKFAVGVLGTDSSTKGKFDDGVEGTSVSGTGVLGNTKSGTGVSGVATTGTGVSGATTTGFGVTGIATTGTGLAGLSQNVGVLGDGTNVGVEANGASIGLQANASTAIQATGSSTGNVLELDSSGAELAEGFHSGNLVFFIDPLGDIATTANVTGFSGAFNDTTGDPAVDATAPDAAINATTTNAGSSLGAIRAYTSGGPIYEGNVNGTDVLFADGAGNLTIAGQLFTSGVCINGCIAHGPDQKRVVSYAPRESQPTMEDFGEGQLVNGEAHVALDPKFANVIDQSANYLVFAMPEGDCNGLFIAGKTPTGFTVRELRGGHATLSFEYRIVAKPFGDHSSRLPTVSVRTQAIPHVGHPMPHLTPAQRGVR
jgi:hypothetical protein